MAGGSCAEGGYADGGFADGGGRRAVTSVVVCICSSAPDTLSYTDSGYDEIKATLVYTVPPKAAEPAEMHCSACGQQWVFDYVPFLHVDVDVLAKKGFDYWPYWMTRIKGHP